MIYDQAVYDILYYDSNLAAYRTDHFGGWQNQPLSNGTPLFTYGTLQYTLLTDATAVPSPTPAASVAASTAPGATAAPVASPAPVPASSSGGDNTALYVGNPGRRPRGGRRSAPPAAPAEGAVRGRGVAFPAAPR